MELSDQTLSELHLEKGSYIYFIGIGGSSMSGLAELSLSRGYRVAGSDIGPSTATEKLEKLGIKVNIGHDAANITDDIALVVYTVAISRETNPEYLRALELEKPVVERGLYLGCIAKHYNKTVAVSGVHGKTTTTSMLTTILRETGRNPSAHVGGVIPGIESNVLAGGKEIFVTEACEYHDNFLHVHPFSGAILNIEPEHLDYFKKFSNVKKSFNAFARNIDENGYLIVCADSCTALARARHTRAKIITYSTKRKKAPFFIRNARGEKVFSHLYAGNLRKIKGGEGIEAIRRGYTYTLYRDGNEIADVTLSVPGLYNVSDSLASIALAGSVGCDDRESAAAVSSFKGAKRRFEFVGMTGSGAYVISDYAHHPSEVKVTVNAAKENAPRKVIAVFQPHTYSRAKRFKRKFARGLKSADSVIVTDIYAAREKDTGVINSRMLDAIFRRRNVNSVYISSFDDIAAKIKADSGSEDVVLLLGAGTVDRIAKLIVEK